MLVVNLSSAYKIGYSAVKFYFKLCNSLVIAAKPLFVRPCLLYSTFLTERFIFFYKNGPKPKA